MRRRLRHLLITSATAATVVGLASPANAALTVRAQWNMDSLPTMVDSAGGDNNGSTRNITLSGGTYSFNGTSSVATVPDSPNLDPSNASIKLTARISMNQAPASSGQTFDIVRKGVTTSAGGDYKLEIVRSSTGLAIPSCVFKDSNGAVGMVRGSVGLANKGFVTISCTKTATGVTVSAAGQTRTTTARIGSISNASPVYVGAKGDGTDWFPGLIDQVEIQIG